MGGDLIIVNCLRQRVGEGTHLSPSHAGWNFDEARTDEIRDCGGKFGIHVGSTDLAVRGRSDEVRIDDAKGNARSQQFQGALVVVHGAGDVEREVLKIQQ